LRRVFALLATLLVLVVVAQFFLAASGAFDTALNDESFQQHRGLGYEVVVFSILLTMVAALARMPGRLIGAHEYWCQVVPRIGSIWTPGGNPPSPGVGGRV